MRCYPALQMPYFDAALGTEHSFVMKLHIKDKWDALAHHFGSYGYFWEVMHVPNDDFAQLEQAAVDKGFVPSQTDVLRADFERDWEYAQADVGTAIESIESLLDVPAGLGAMSLVTANSALRPIGSMLQSFAQVMTRPRGETAIVFPHSGLFVVRCRAVHQVEEGEDAEVIRADSVAWMPVYARAKEDMADLRLRAAEMQRDNAHARMDTLREELATETDPEKLAELEAELVALDTSLNGTAVDKLELQLTALEEALANAEAPKDRERIQKQIDMVRRTLSRRRERTENLENSISIQAIFVSDRGAVINLLIEAAEQQSDAGSAVWYVADSTTDKGRDAVGIGTSPSAAIQDALTTILEGEGGYGRGHLSGKLPAIGDEPAATFRLRVERDLTGIAMEAIDNITLVMSVAAVAAAPFTGGASLAVLVPVGIVGAVPSAYRLADKAATDTLALDVQTCMQIVDVASAVVSVGKLATPLKWSKLGTGLYIAELGLDGLGLMVLGGGMLLSFKEIMEDENLSEGQRRAKIMMKFGEALMTAGVIAGGSVYSTGKRKMADSGGDPTLRVDADVTPPKDSGGSPPPKDSGGSPPPKDSGGTPRPEGDVRTPRDEGDVRTPRDEGTPPVREDATPPKEDGDVPVREDTTPPKEEGDAPVREDPPKKADEPPTKQDAPPPKKKPKPPESKVDPKVADWIGRPLEAGPPPGYRYQRHSSGKTMMIVPKKRPSKLPALHVRDGRIAYGPKRAAGRKYTDPRVEPYLGKHIDDVGTPPGYTKVNGPHGDYLRARNPAQTGLPALKLENGVIKPGKPRVRKDTPAQRRKREEELSKDESGHGGKQTPNSKMEAEAGLALEDAGLIKGPIKRAKDKGEFEDGDGTVWDVKRFDTRFPKRKGGFDLQRDLGKIQSKVIDRGMNAILDTRNMKDAAQLEAFVKAVEAQPWANRVLWYPPGLNRLIKAGAWP